MNIEHSLTLNNRKLVRLAAAMAGTFAFSAVVGVPSAQAQNFVPSPNGSSDHKWVMVDDQVVPASAVIGLNESAVPGKSRPFSLAPYANKWPNGRVAYVYDDSMSPNKRAIFESGCREWEKFANLRFTPRVAEGNYIRVVSTVNDSNSPIGMVGGAQTMNLADWADKYTVMHELAHALGIIHEQSRPDRDTYVTIHPENITDGYAHNFDKVAGALNQGDYDFDSFMHYYATAFSKNGQATITANAGYTQFQGKMGQGNHTSKLDAQGMAKIYGGSIAYGDAISPAEPKTNDILTAKTSDPDATFVWKKNSLVISGETSKTLDLSKVGNGDKGDLVAVEISGSAPDAAQVLVLNSAPVTPAREFEVNNNETLTGQFEATDDDGDAPLTFLLLTDANKGTLTLNSDGSFSYVPNAGFVGSDSFRVAANDGQTSGAPMTMKINVTANPDVPTLSNANFDIIKDFAFSAQLAGRDANGDTLYYSVVEGQLPDGLKLSSSGLLSGTPTTLGATEVTVRVSDLKDGSSAAKLTINVKSDSSAPSVTATISSTAPKTGDTVKVSARVTDPRNSPVTTVYKFSVNDKVVQAGTSDTLDLSKPNFGDKGDEIKCEILATNESGNSSSALVTATVVNSEPVAFSGRGDVDADVEKSFDLNSFDADGDELTLVLVDAPTKGKAELRVDPTDGKRKLFYRSFARYNGTDAVKFAATEKAGKTSNVSTFAINVRYIAPPVNRAPVAGDTFVDTFVGKSLVKGLLGSDPDGDALTFRVVNNAKYGTSEIKRDKDGQFKLFYTSLNRFYGDDRVTYVAVDSKGAQSNIATVGIKFGNRAPVAQSNQFDVAAGVASSQYLFGTDEDGDALTFRLINNPRYGKGEIKRDAQGKWRVYYQSLSGYAGPDRLNFVALDPQGKQSPVATINFNVVRVTTAPSGAGALQSGNTAPSAGNS